MFTETITVAGFQSCALGTARNGIDSSVEAAFCFPVPLCVQGVHVLESLGHSRPGPLNLDKSGDAAAPLENTFLEEPFSLGGGDTELFPCPAGPTHRFLPPQTHVSDERWSDYPLHHWILTYSPVLAPLR